MCNVSPAGCHSGYLFQWSFHGLLGMGEHLPSGHVTSGGIGMHLLFPLHVVLGVVCCLVLLGRCNVYGETCSSPIFFFLSFRCDFLSIAPTHVFGPG